MTRKDKKEMLYRYYEMPVNSPVLALWGPSLRAEKDRLHFHNYMEIGYCYEGSCFVVLDKNEFSCSSGAFTIIPKNIPHKTVFREEIVCRWKYLIIDTDNFLSGMYRDDSLLAGSLIRRVNHLPYLIDENRQEKTTVLIKQILALMSEQDELYLEELKGLLAALLINIARLNGESPQEKLPLPKTVNAAIIAPALDYISLVPEQPVRIDELAALCHVSEAHFRRVFVECMKMPPLQYIHRVRIRRACDELLRTNDPINAIAARAGFGTLSTFNRNFRQITGISPQQLRRQSGHQK